MHSPIWVPTCIRCVPARYLSILARHDRHLPCLRFCIIVWQCNWSSCPMSAPASARLFHCDCKEKCGGIPRPVSESTYRRHKKSRHQPSAEFSQFLANESTSRSSELLLTAAGSLGPSGSRAGPIGTHSVELPASGAAEPQRKRRREDPAVGEVVCPVVSLCTSL
jgi:hypothetical protein